jgi:pimeloyl-ACP methyl ester carboxylesterase
MPVPIPAASPLDARAEIAIEEMQARSATEQLHRTIGQVTVVGEIAALNDPRFKLDDASSGLWRPIDYLITSPPGIYFLEPYDPRKTPVLFVHGINGTPANFTFLIGQVDRSRFQSWIYHYPSGVQLNNVADHLDQTMAKLELRYGVARYAVVAHSMGGLVARGFIQRRTASARRAQIPQFVSIATPWAGHDAARMGVSFSPAVVNVWNDMVPGSAYIETVLAQPLPAETEHHLLFTFLRSGMSLGESSDGTVTIASQLDWRAQAGAVQRYGFNESHDGVLEQANVARLLNAILAGTKASPH